MVRFTGFDAIVKILYENEEETRRAQKKRDEKPGTPITKTISKLWQGVSKSDKFTLIIGAFASVLSGATYPLIAYTTAAATESMLKHLKTVEALRGNQTHELNLLELSKNKEDAETTLFKEMKQISLGFVFIGLILMTTTFINIFCWETVCSRQISKIKQLLFAQSLRKDMTWFDLKQEKGIMDKLANDSERIRVGLGSKIPYLVYTLTLTVCSLFWSFRVSPTLSCFVLMGAPVITGVAAHVGKAAAQSASREQARYSAAGAICSEVLTAIRVVISFGGQKLEINRYTEAVETAQRETLKRIWGLGITMPLTSCFFYLLSALCVWASGKMLSTGEITPGEVLIVLVNSITTMTQSGHVLTILDEVGGALGSAGNIFSILDEIPSVDCYSEEGVTVAIEGKIEFKDVYFSYPSRTSVMVLRGMNLMISPGKVIAIVGSSGSGKSTIFNLLLRFYDPLCGQVLIDGLPIQNLNLPEFRKNIGVVSQDAVLFDASVEENIRYGKPDASLIEVINAAKLANAHNFITSMPCGYDTVVGENGISLSGGQKQRIAIARALIKNPKILLLDEATSALDLQSEAIVQEAIERAGTGRTTVIIAHRLSTVRKADEIYVMKNGLIVERGSHSELLNLNGVYYGLVQTQNSEFLPEYQSEILPCERNTPIPTKSKRLSLMKSLSIRKIVRRERNQEINVEPESHIKYLDVLKLNSRGGLVFAIVSSCCAGLPLPCSFMVYRALIRTFTLPRAEQESMTSTIAACYALLALLAFFVSGFSVISTGYSSEKVIKELRCRSFQALMLQRPRFFDRNGPLSIAGTLASDPPHAKTLTGMRAGLILASSVTFVSSLILCFTLDWRCALVMWAFAPVVIYGNQKQAAVQKNFGFARNEIFHKANKIVAECTQNVKTVQFLCLQRTMVDKYVKLLNETEKKEKFRAFCFSTASALSNSTILFAFALTSYLTVQLISSGSLSLDNFYTITYATGSACGSVGAALFYLKDFSNAKVSIGNLWKIMTSPVALDPFSVEGENPEIKGKIEFRDVLFSYPGRGDTVLAGLNLTVESGKTVAIVGSSGAGKSTLIALLERFYEPDLGKIVIDGMDIRKMNVSYLRANIGLVTQDPVLFSRSIRDNIAYGVEGLGRQAEDAEIHEAAKIAAIHNDIMALPQGYETEVGLGGSKLSGGQKQRIALARALLRNPKILLLDEATSALDTVNEQVVQETLDIARRGRTTIVIAHNMATVRKADVIAVLHKGVIAEQGTHDELMEKSGLYYNLHNKC